MTNLRRRLVRRSEGAIDRRERTVALTGGGKTLLERIATARSARFEASLAVVPPRLAARLESVLVEVVGALEERL